MVSFAEAGLVFLSRRHCLVVPASSNLRVIPAADS